MISGLTGGDRGEVSPKGYDMASHTKVAAMAGGNSGFPSPDGARLARDRGRG